MRRFRSDVCPAYKTKDLPSEEVARVRRQASQVKKAATTLKKKPTQRAKSDATKPKKKAKHRNFNMAFYKLHSLGGYARSIREHGTTDNTSSQTVVFNSHDLFMSC
jgi:hypothetical protein